MCVYICVLFCVGVKMASYTNDKMNILLQSYYICT